MEGRYVFDFSEGWMEQLDLLGGKRADLAEMTRLGLPVPPGFTITTEACREYLASGEAPAGLRFQVTLALRRLEDVVGRRLGDLHDPLRVSVTDLVRGEPTGFEVFSQLVEHCPGTENDGTRFRSIDPSSACALVPSHPAPRHYEERRVINEVEQIIEPAVRIGDRPLVQLGLHRMYP